MLDAGEDGVKCLFEKLASGSQNVYLFHHLGPVNTNYDRGDEAIFVAMQGIPNEVCPRHMSEK